MSVRLWTTAALAALTLLACDSEDEATGGGDVADEDFYMGEASAALGADGNQARCATCHTEDGTLGRSGNTLKDIAYHGGFKGEAGAGFLVGVNACVTGWMGGEALTEEDDQYQALLRFVQSISNPSATTMNPIAPEVLADQAAYEAAYSGGDGVAGASKYTEHCGFCHDGALVVNATPAYAKASLGAYGIGRIAQKVRTSGPPPSAMNEPMDSTPGPMPFFEENDLSTTDLKDIIAYLKAQ